MEKETTLSAQQNSRIDQTMAYARETLEGEGSGHDWWHVYRVFKMAVHLAKKEKADVFTVSLAALLHDIADHKFHGGDCTVGPRVAREWLKSLNVEEQVINHVSSIIETMSFKGAKVKSSMDTLEGMIVQDADRMDALGAIGIGRTFAYGGNVGREMYNPEIPPALHETFEQYKNNKSTSINHFHEKLFLLKDLMNTKAGKEVAEERHNFMILFLDHFLAEWDGKDLKKNCERLASPARPLLKNGLGD